MKIIKDEKTITKKLSNQEIDYAKLPVFFKDADNGWVFTGQTNRIYTIEELNEYKEMYAEIYDFIRENFASSIANVYKTALNSFVVYDGQKSKVSELYDTLLRGKSVTNSKVFAKANSNNDKDTVASIKYILNGTNKLLSKRTNQPFKPFRLSGKGMEYVLPEFSAEGVLAKVDGRQISVKFKSVGEQDAKALKDFMLSCVPGETKEEKMLQGIVDEYFSVSKQTADLIKAGAPEDIARAFSELNFMSAYLFDTDLSAYHKPQSQEDEFDYESQDIAGDDFTGETEHIVPVENVTNNVVGGFDFKVPYQTEPVMENGEMFIRISPKDGSFVVTFNEKTRICVIDKETQKGE